MTALHDFGGVCWDGLWTLSFRLSRFHGHGSWLMCEVALSVKVLSSQLTFSSSKCQLITEQGLI